MAERDQHNRWRCLKVGCNPVLLSTSEAEKHRGATGHPIARWPIRSAHGKALAAARYKNGYYDKYNVGEKSAAARGLWRDG